MILCRLFFFLSYFDLSVFFIIYSDPKLLGAIMLISIWLLKRMDENGLFCRAETHLSQGYAASRAGRSGWWNAGTPWPTGSLPNTMTVGERPPWPLPSSKTSVALAQRCDSGWLGLKHPRVHASNHDGSLKVCLCFHPLLTQSALSYSCEDVCAFKKKTNRTKSNQLQAS